MVYEDKVKPPDKLLDYKMKKFESGRDKAYDRDLDEMIWELSDYENEEPLDEAEDFQKAVPIEEELVENKRRNARGRA
jgi:hypothetical protein